MDSGLKTLGGQIMDLSKADPYSFVAGASPLQQQAASAAARLGNFGVSNPMGGMGGQDAYSRLAAGGAPVGGPAIAGQIADMFGGNGTQFAGDSKRAYIDAMGGGARSPGVAADPYGGALSIFDRVANSRANTYNPVTGQAVTGTASLIDSAPKMQAASLLDNLSSYMSPYLNQVVDASLADYDHGAKVQQAQADLDMQASGAFGGSGAYVRRGMMDDSIMRGRGTLAATLRDQGFQTGAALSGQDADRRQAADAANAQSELQRLLANQSATNQFGLANMDAQNQFGLHNMDALNSAGQFNAGQQDTALARALQAAGGMVDTANAKNSNDRSNIELQATLGDQMRQIDAQQRAAPLNLLGTQAGLFGGLPLNLLHGETNSGTATTNSTSTTKESDPVGTISKLMSAAGSLASGAGALGSAGGFASIFSSDRSQKTDIKKVGRREDGLNVYEFRYKDGDKRYRGLMADEVQHVYPHALVKTEDGSQGLDYAKIPVSGMR